MRIRSVVSHGLQAVAEGALIALLVVGLMAGTTFAAKNTSGGHGKPSGGGTTGGGTIVVPNGVYAQTVTATVSPAGLWVHSSCKQGTQQVYAQYVLSDANGAAVLTLGPTYYWTG